MNEERQAQLLAEWLEAPEGTPVPEGLDLDVAEAMWVLKPELAPAPRMSSADLLASLDVAPVAAAAAVPASIDQGEAEVIDFASRRKRRLWYGAGVFAAAAMALIVIVPGANQLSGEAGPAMTAAEAPAFAPEPELAEVADASVEADLAERTVLDELSDIAREAAEEEPVGGDFAQLTPVAKQEPLPASAPDLPAELAAATSRTRTGATLSLGGADEQAEPSDLDLDGAIVADAADDFAAAPTASFEGWANDTGLGRAEAEPMPEAEEALEALEAPEVAYELPPEDPYGLVSGDATASYSAPKRSSSSRAERKEDRNAEREDEDLLTSGSTSSPVPWPADYSASWYRSSLSGELLEQAEAAFSSADSHAAVGRTDAAVDALVALMGTGHVHLAQDAAGRAAQLLQQAGRSDEALAMTRRGRGLSSANSAFLSRLWAIEGSLHQARGDLAQATHAYTTAQNLNAARATSAY